MKDLHLKIVDEQIHYFCSEGWGAKVADDKYWDDEQLLDSFIIFYVYAFAWLNLPRPSRAQLEMAKHISDKRNPHRMLMAMRGLSKSLTAQVYTVWRLFNNPDEHILVMSASGTRAENFTAFVQKVIKLLPATQHMAPRHGIERTSSKSFDVAGAMESDSPSVYAVGVENQIAGFRATLVIYDDIETKQNSTSAVMSEKIDHYAKEAHNLLMSGHDESITLCTPHSRMSIYMKWIEEGNVPLIIPSEYPEDVSVYGGYLAPYIVERLKKFPALVGSNVDERIDDKFLETRKRKIGKSEYKLQYMLDVSDSDDMRHPLKLRELIVMDVGIDEGPMKVGYSSMPENEIRIRHHGFSNDKLYSPSSVSADMEPYWRRVMSIDPSGRGNDETAYSIGFSLNGRAFVKEVGGFSGGYGEEELSLLMNIAALNKIDTIVIESNFGDGMFTKLLNNAIRKKKLNIRIEETRASGQKEVRIINTIEPLMNQRRVIFDKSFLERDYENAIAKSLTYQLTHINRNRDCLAKDDRIDSLEILLNYLSVDVDVDEDRYSEIREEEERAKLYDFLSGSFPFATRMNFGEKY